MSKIFEDLTIDEKIGQMIMVGMDVPNVIDKIDDLILKYKVGGILLYKKNYKNYEELVELINYIKKINTANKVPLFIAIDQEGGRVNRMPNDFDNIPSPHSLAKYKKENMVEEAGDITGEMLNMLGFNFDFAPVMDIKRFSDNHAIGDRAFSENKEIVSKCGIDYMKQLQNHNVVSVIKHFPGHGATNMDSHFILPIVKKRVEDIESEDIFPFREAMKNGADAMLISHLKIKEIAKYPCSMSREFIVKYVRRKYNYKGLLITDDFGMKGVQILYGKKFAAKKGFEAGNDIIVVKYQNDEDCLENIIKSVKKNKKLQYKINNSVKKILDMKEKYNCNNDEIVVDKNFLNYINKKINGLKEKLENNNN